MACHTDGRRRGCPGDARGVAGNGALAPARRYYGLLSEESILSVLSVGRWWVGSCGDHIYQIIMIWGRRPSL